MQKKIENEEQYEKSISWLISTSAKIADPLLNPAEKAKLQKIYDYVSEEVQRYRRGELAKKFPGLREVYQNIGWDFYEPEPEHPEMSDFLDE